MIPRFRDFLLILIILLSIGALTSQILVLLSANSHKAQTDIGKQKRTLLQNTLYGFFSIFPLIILVNYLAVQRDYNFDLSSVGKFSFSETSRVLLKDIQKDVEITAFYPRNLEASGKEESFALSAIRPDVEIFLQKLTAINGRFKSKFINADVETELLGEYGQISNGSILIRSLKTGSNIGGNPYLEEKVMVQNKKDLEGLERKLVQAIHNVTIPQKKFYFTKLNGERYGTNTATVPDENTEKFISALGLFNFQVKGLGLEEGWPGKIPDDADIVGIIGPTVAFSDEAQKTVLEYIKTKNGRVFITIDPKEKEDFKWLLDKSKLEFRKESLRQAQGRVEIIATNFPEHPISSLFTKKETGVVFPWSGFFEKKNSGGSEFFETNILETGSAIFIDKNNNNQLDKEEKQGNFILGSILTTVDSNTKDAKDKPYGKVIIFSGTSWLTDRYFLYNLNPIFAVNSANWLNQNPLIDTILPKKEENPSITLTSNQKIVIWAVGLFGYPLLTMAALTWYVVSRRRKRSDEASV